MTPHALAMPSESPSLPTHSFPPPKLPAGHLRLALHDILRAPKFNDRGPERAQERLWREDPQRVLATYDDIVMDRLDAALFDSGSGRHGLRAERMRELHRPILSRDKTGLTVSQMASRAGLAQETMARLLEFNGYLELCPFGRHQNRRLLTQRAAEVGLGHNVDPSHCRSARLDGPARAVVFPVFYEDSADDIIWSLGWDMIILTCQAEPPKKRKLSYLLKVHGYLPDAAIGELSGYTVDGVGRARKRATTHYGQGPTRRAA